MRSLGAARGATILVIAAALVLMQPASGQGPAPGVAPQPVLGAIGADANLMGAAASTGEAWGYALLPTSVGAVTVGGTALEFGTPADASRPDPQLVFVRHREATGWQIAETPLKADGLTVLRGMVPNRLSARITPAGGGILIGGDPGRPADSQVVVLSRDPGGRFRELPAPPPGVLLSGEALASERGTGRVAVAAIEEGGDTGLFVAPVGLAVEDAIVHWDGSAWAREPIAVPAGSESEFEVLAIAATSTGNAFALARTDPALGRGVVLLERTTPGGGPLWVERSLGATVFEARDTGAQGVAGVQALGGAAQPLTATSDGVWIDGALEAGGAPLNFTLFYSAGDDHVTGSWCDAGVCDHSLGARLAVRDGYRSFAWPGGEFGTRVVTNPLDAGGGEDTNRGTYLRFDGTEFARMPGAGGSFRDTGAFFGPDAGWLEGPVEITTSPSPTRLRAWPVSLRAPLTDVAGRPGTPPGSLDSQALAVGADGSVARYEPGTGWRREFLLSSSDAVNRSTLRGVAWPEPGRAHAVGDLGAMWQWNVDNNRWEPDQGAPVGFEGNLMDVGFQPGDPDNGFAVGKGGVLLRYGKSWDQEALPAGFESRDLTQVAYAGSQVLVAAGGDLLSNEGGAWHVEEGARSLLDRVRSANPQLYAVAGLPDGGAVAAGREIVIVRDGGPGSPWRFSDQPLLGSTVIALAPLRAGARVRSIVSVVPRLAYPRADELPEPDPNVPPPVVPPFGLPGDGYVLRETDQGWRDEQRAAFAGSGSDRPFKADPILAFDLDGAGNGWAVGGWSGDADSAGRGSSARNSAGRTTRTRVRTAGIYRYGDDSGTQPPGSASAAAVAMPAGPVRLAVGGHAQCEAPCADLAAQGIAPDRSLSRALATVADLSGPNGPRAMLYTGSRVRVAASPEDERRYAELLRSQPGVPVYPALSESDPASAFGSSFAAFPSPFGSGPAPAGTDSSGIPGLSGGPGARTHYAFDTSGAGGELRVIVIDNSAGSLALSDPHQNPPEPQLPWLEAVLADAKSEGVPAVVMGSRDLNTRFSPRLNVASDGDEVAHALVVGGASAYVFDRPEENRAYSIPAGAAETIPTFASGTLGYRSPLVGAIGTNTPDSLFGDPGVMLLEVHVDRRNPSSNRAPVGVRLIPLIEDLSIEAVDGALLRRSRPALFRGLGRRPRAGDRWGRVAAGDGNPDPPGADPYVNLPPEQCLIAGCSARISPEYEFVSSDPDIADFVRQDPNSTNLRKPFVESSTDKVVTDSSSGLLCPFNAGTTTVTIRAGGLAFAQQVRVQAGSVQRPCGTRPLSRGRFRTPPAAVQPPPPPPPGPSPSPTVDFAPPPPPPPPPPSAPAAPPKLVPKAPPIPLSVLPVPTQPPALSATPAIPPPPPPPAVRPLPPGGAPARVYQVEEKREEEAALEESQAFSRYEPDGHLVPPAFVLAMIALAALAGAAARPRAVPRSGVKPAPAHLTSRPPINRRRSRP